MRRDGEGGPIVRAVTRAIEADLDRDPASCFAVAAVGSTWFAQVKIPAHFNPPFPWRQHLDHSLTECELFNLGPVLMQAWRATGVLLLDAIAEARG